MANMSYCRHENTEKDLSDVVERWHDFNHLEASIYEIESREKIIELAKMICEMEGEL